MRWTRRSVGAIAGWVLGILGACAWAADPAASGVAKEGGSSPYQWRNVALGGGGYCTHLVIHPKDPNIVYMGTDMGGAYRWDAPASRWTPITDGFAEPTRYGVESIAVDPNDVNKVYLTLGQHLYNPLGGIYVSTNKGSIWQCGLKIRVDGGDGQYGKSSGERLAVDPNNSKVVYYGSRRYVQAAVASKAQAAVSQAGLYRSTDAGATWDHQASFPVTGEASVGLSWVAIDGKGGTVDIHGQTLSRFVYVGVYDTLSTNGGVWRTDDGGQNWSKLTSRADLRTAGQGRIASDGRLYASDLFATGKQGKWSGGIETCARGDTTLSVISPLNPVPDFVDFNAIAIDPSDPAVVVCGERHAGNLKTFGCAVHRSTDAGKTWAVVGGTEGTFTRGNGNGTRPPGAWFGKIAAIAINPADPGQVWVTDFLGALRCRDIRVSKPTWDFMSAGHEQTCTWAMRSPPAGEAVLFSAVADVDAYRHTDLDVSPKTSLSHDVGNGYSIDYCESNPNVLVRTYDDFGFLKTGFYSTNNGVTWTRFARTPSFVRPDPKWGSINYQAEDGQIVCSATDPQHFVWLPFKPYNFNGGMDVPWYTRDSGKKWTAGTGVPPDGWANRYNCWSRRPLCADRVNGLKFYYVKNVQGTQQAPGFAQLYRSLDGGATWAAAGAIKYDPGHPVGFGKYKIEAMPGKEGEVWVYLGLYGIYRSSDSGESFTRVAKVGGNSGLYAFGKAAPGRQNPAVFYMANDTSGKVGDPAAGKVYRSDDATSLPGNAAGATWVLISVPEQPFGDEPRAMEGDRRVYGRVYIGTDGRGMYYGQPQ